MPLTGLPKRYADLVARARAIGYRVWFLVEDDPNLQRTLDRGGRARRHGDPSNDLRLQLDDLERAVAQLESEAGVA